MGDSSKIKLQIFFVRCVAAVAFLVLRDRRTVRKVEVARSAPTSKR
ncbi:hypothetical protein QUF49_05305 [Fictibacillus sp. b24]|nr:hypothetical protein [Fictibacillus sp. b24]MDM5315404.1 hypothetical protein [Fictibacillus sp. b24]